MTDLIHDTGFWVLVSFILFIVVFLKYGKAKVLASIDGKIDAIKTELTVAERLRVEAQELLAEYKRKHKDAIGEADTIIARAKETAEALRIKAEEDLSETLERREAQLNDRLSRIEQAASQDIQAYTAKIAINAARDIMADGIDAKTDKAIINNNLDTVSKALN